MLATREFFQSLKKEVHCKWQNVNYVTKPGKPGIELALQEAKFLGEPIRFGRLMLKR